MLMAYDNYWFRDKEEITEALEKERLLKIYNAFAEEFNLRGFSTCHNENWGEIRLVGTKSNPTFFVLAEQMAYSFVLKRRRSKEETTREIDKKVIFQMEELKHIWKHQKLAKAMSELESYHERLGKNAA